MEIRGFIEDLRNVLFVLFVRYLDNNVQEGFGCVDLEFKRQVRVGDVYLGFSSICSVLKVTGVDEVIEGERVENEQRDQDGFGNFSSKKSSRVEMCVKWIRSMRLRMRLFQAELRLFNWSGVCFKMLFSFSEMSRLNKVDLNFFLL